MTVGVVFFRFYILFFLSVSLATGSDFFLCGDTYTPPSFFQGLNTAMMLHSLLGRLGAVPSTGVSGGLSEPNSQKNYPVFLQVFFFRIPGVGQLRLIGVGTGLSTSTYWAAGEEGTIRTYIHAHDS